MTTDPHLGASDFVVGPHAVRAMRSAPVYNLHQANAQAAAQEEGGDFTAQAMLQLLLQRFGPVKKDAAEAFALHSGKDVRTVYRYLSGELPIPRWVVFMTMVICEKSNFELHSLWVQARKAAEDYSK